MSPEKMIRATRRGLKTLLPRIERLEEELKPLKVAFSHLAAMKLDAQLETTPIKIIPIGMTRKKAAAEAAAMRKNIEQMGDEEALELLSKLERRLK
jgi:uncharacterized protein (UPF0335 family)